LRNILADKNPGIGEEIRRRVYGTLGVGVARVSPFQGWIGLGGRCSQGVALGYLLWPRCGQHRLRWRNSTVLPRCGHTGLVGAPHRLAALRPTSASLAQPLRLTTLRPTPGRLVHLFRLAAFGHMSPHQKLHNDRPYLRAPTGCPAIARGNALGIAPPNQSSPERARFHAAILCPNPHTPPLRTFPPRVDARRQRGGTPRRAETRSAPKRPPVPCQPRARTRRSAQPRVGLASHKAPAPVASRPSRPSQPMAPNRPCTRGVPRMLKGGSCLFSMRSCRASGVLPLYIA